MEKVIYSGNQGLGIIMDDLENESDYIDEGWMPIVGTKLNSGDKTKLFGFFTREVVFVGTLKDNPKCMVFLLGNDSDLFDSKRYYACLYWITPTRIVNKYKEGTARDFIYKDGKWK